VGKHVFQVRWAYDGAAQGGKKVAFGNTWVVLALVLRLRLCPSPVALPVLFPTVARQGRRLPAAACRADGETAGWAFPGRVVHGTGDAAFHSKSLVIRGTT
jgi:hypothetical protein